MISPQRIGSLARSLGVVRRRRKVDVVALVYTLVLGLGGGGRRTFASLRRAYEHATGTDLVAGAHARPGRRHARAARRRRDADERRDHPYAPQLTRTVHIRAVPPAGPAIQRGSGGCHFRQEEAASPAQARPSCEGSTSA